MEKPKVNKKRLTYQEEIMVESNLMTKKEVAKLLKLSITSIDRWVKKGKLKVTKLGGEHQSRCYYFRSDVLNLLGLSEQC